MPELLDLFGPTVLRVVFDLFLDILFHKMHIGLKHTALIFDSDLLKHFGFVPLLEIQHHFFSQIQKQYKLLFFVILTVT